MKTSLNFIKNSVLGIAILYILFIGLMIIGGVLSWLSWDFIGEWIGRIGFVALLVAALSGVIAVLAGLFRKSLDSSRHLRPFTCTKGRIIFSAFV
jgi:hypothetical protein